MDNPQQRKETLVPNKDRSLDQAGQDPEAVAKIAREFLFEASFAAALFDTTTALSLTRAPSDRIVWRKDHATMRALCSFATIDRTTIKDHLLAPVARFFSRAKVRSEIASLIPSSQQASLGREEVVSRLKRSKRVVLTPGTPVSEWPVDECGKAVTPLKISLDSNSKYAVSLNTYQVQAAGIVEMVRAAGKILGDCDGDALANRFQLMVLAYGGVRTAWGSDEGATIALKKLTEKDCLLRGAFLRAAEYPNSEGGFAELEPFKSIINGDIERSEGGSWWPLSGPDQLLAITILGAWLRMSTLGVRLSSWETLAQWRDFFDGYRYEVDKSLVGLAFIMEDADAKKALDRYELHGKWTNPERAGQVPWFVQEGGSPLVFLGMAADLLKRATFRCGILDFVSEGFVVTPADEDVSERNLEIALPIEMSIDAIPHGMTFGDTKLIQLRNIYTALSGSPQGCARAVELVSDYNIPRPKLRKRLFS